MMADVQLYDRQPPMAWQTDAATARRTTASVMTFATVETVSALEDLEAEWNALSERAGAAHHVFQSHSFVLTWARSKRDSENRSSASCRLAILIARRHGRLVMVWPLVMERRFGVRALTWLGSPISQYGDVLIDKVDDTLALLEEGWSEACRRFSPDVVRLGKVRADAAVMPLLTRLDSTPSNQQVAPVAKLKSAAATGFEDRQSGKACKNRRRLMRRLEEAGQVTFCALASGPEAVAMAMAGLHQKRRWINARGLYSAAFATDMPESFFRRMLSEQTARSETAQPMCRVYGLCLDGVPVAVAIGFVADRQLLLYLISYDLAHEKAGVGCLNAEAVLRHCEAEGLHAVDFLAPNADYKTGWTDATVGVADHVIGITAKGRACANLYDGVIVPSARRTINYALPRLRSGIAKLAFTTHSLA